MEFVRSVKIKTSFSFAVCLIDSYTSAPAIGKDHIVSIQGLTVKPIPKIDGYYIFTDLPLAKLSGCCSIQVLRARNHRCSASFT